MKQAPTCAEKAGVRQGALTKKVRTNWVSPGHVSGGGQRQNEGVRRPRGETAKNREGRKGGPIVTRKGLPWGVRVDEGRRKKILQKVWSWRPGKKRRGP